MEDLCGSAFWNTTLTWETESPDFTICFEKTILSWAPCLLLCLFSPIEAYRVVGNKHGKHLPWRWRNTSKLVLNAVLCVLCLVDIGKAASLSSQQSDQPLVHIVTPILKLLSFLLAGVILYAETRCGIRTSGPLTLFWLCAMVLGIPQYRTELLEELYQRPENQRLQITFITYMVYLPLVGLLFFLNCFADESSTESAKVSYLKNTCPEEDASFPNYLFFSWSTSLVWKGYRKSLEVKDLWELSIKNTCQSIVRTFNRYWIKNVLEKNSYGESSHKYQLSVVPALWKSFGTAFFFSILMDTVSKLSIFINPQVLDLLIAYTSSQDPVWKGILYSVALMLTSVFQSLLFSQSVYIMSLVGMRARSALISAIFRKAMCISSASKKESTLGEIVNLMAVDAQRLVDLSPYATIMWTAPLQICVAMYFLYQSLGPAAFAGLGAMLLMIPVNGGIAAKLEKIQIHQMKNKDTRVKLMNEVLNGIKVLKLYAWEVPFASTINAVRGREIKALKSMAILQASSSVVFYLTPFLVSLVSFLTYIMIDENNVLDARVAFVSLSLFNILRIPLFLLPVVLSFCVQTAVSIKRINKFMNCDDVNPDNVSRYPAVANPLEIRNGSFSWGPGEPPVLNDVNLNFEKNTLVAVVGSVGSGKTSLISALLGEMHVWSGSVNVQGSVAYVPQQAWIQNATLRDNILFGEEFDENRYEEVVHACALKADLEMLPGGDQTEIGEKGINLSGGQKQRVSLARAVYSDSAVILLDDPLSAVDSHVGKHIFSHVLGQNGILKNKTRVLVTHGVSFLREADLVVVLKDGQVSESGSYQELLERQGDFAEFLLQHLNDTDEDAGDIQAELERVAGRETIQRRISEISQRSENSNDSTPSTARLNSKQDDDDQGGQGNTGKKLIEAENVETGKVKLKVYLHYLRSIGVKTTVATLVSMCLSQIFSGASNLWLSEWSNDGEMLNSTSPNFVAGRNMYLGVYGGLGAGQVFFNTVFSFTFGLGSVVSAAQIHEKAFARTLRCPMSFFDITPIGRMLNRFSKDIESIDTALPMVLRETMIMTFEVLTTIVIICYSSLYFIIVIIPLAVLYFFAQRFFVATTRQLKRLDAITRSPIYSHFSESLTGGPSIRAYQQVTRFINEAERRIDHNQKCCFPVIVTSRWMIVRLEMLGAMISFFAALFAVLGRGSISAGLVGLSVTYSLQITENLNWMVQMITESENNIVCVERVKEYCATPQEAAWESTSESVDPKWPAKGNVEFIDYAVRYREGLPLVLRGISFIVKGGQKVGIVGRTGAGKSSLTLALFRIIEAARGKVLIDGVDIATLGLHTLRSRITIIPQDPVLFSGTLRFNLDPAGRHLDTEIWAALEGAHLKPTVKAFPGGLNHEINEGGENLSVGQRQLVCLARALLRKTKVLVFDEATAAVDLETDDLIQETIRRDFKDCTILTIAHRLNTIIDSNLVLVLSHGLIQEFDSPQSLLGNRNSAFYALAKDAGLV